MSEEALQRLMGLADEYGRLCHYGGWPKGMRENARSTLESALREALQPAGWRLVPVEPTDKMTFVGQQLRRDPVNSIGHIYRAMLSAVPEQPLGDALSGPGHTLQPPSSASAAVPIADARDAARYRFVRGKFTLSDWGSIAIPTGRTRLRPEDTDAAIDAAMAAPTPQEPT